MVTEQHKDDLLEMMYRMTSGVLNKTVILGVVRQAHFHHWDKHTFFDTAQALVDENLIVLRSRVGNAALTLDGHRRVEAHLYPSQTLTQNTITVDTMINSPIQQSGAYATMTQTVTYNTQDLDDLRSLVDVFKNHLEDLGLDATAKRRASAQVATLEAQLEDEPDPVIVKQAGSTLRSITEKVIAGLIVAAATNQTVWTQAHAIMSRLF